VRSLVAAAVIAGVTRSASAAPSVDVDAGERPHLLDTEAMLFIWLPLGSAIAIDTVPPRSTPLGFDPDEGGKEAKRDYEIPQLSITVGGAAIVGAIALGNDPSRGYHAKGMLESMATSALITTATKVVVGRHRPDFVEGSTDPDERKSFPSGHTTRAFSVVAYTALWLRYHGFDRWREPGTLPSWEALTYVGLGGLAIGFAGERVERHRHNKSDVAVGGFVGAASSIAFFYWQEHRYRQHAKQRRLDGGPLSPRDLFGPHARPVVLPTTD
jgi:membrane-associated phospholipid phosphatase